MGARCLSCFVTGNNACVNSDQFPKTKKKQKTDFFLYELNKKNYFIFALFPPIRFTFHVFCFCISFTRGCCSNFNNKLFIRACLHFQFCFSCDYFLSIIYYTRFLLSRFSSAPPLRLLLLAYLSISACFPSSSLNKIASEYILCGYAKSGRCCTTTYEVYMSFLLSPSIKQKKKEKKNTLKIKKNY